MKYREISIYFVVLMATFILFEFTSLDQFCENLFFNFRTHIWLIDRNEMVLRILFYDGIKFVLILVYLIFLVFYLVFRKHKARVEYKAGILIFLLSMALVPGVISRLKAASNIPCPRELKIFDGTFPYTHLFESYPADFKPPKKCKCYPAGHASGGFALFSLFFLFKTTRNRKWALAFALFVGWSMGLYKMAIGDHFLSHTVMTMILSWFMVRGIAWVVQSKISHLSVKERCE